MRFDQLPDRLFHVVETESLSERAAPRGVRQGATTCADNEGPKEGTAMMARIRGKPCGRWGTRVSFRTYRLSRFVPH
jgi:hypothetical protein